MDRLQFAQDLRDLSMLAERLSQNLDALSPAENAALVAAFPHLDRLYQKIQASQVEPGSNHQAAYRLWIESIPDGFLVLDQDWHIT